MLADAGVDNITIMDSAGAMFPEQAAYVSALNAAVSVPVGFHGHSDLGLSQANALAAALRRAGYLPKVGLYKLLDYLENKLIPAMEAFHYHPAVPPIDLVLGLSGCHSNALPLFRKVANDEKVPLARLVTEVSAIDRKSPDEELLRRVASTLRNR